MTTNDTLLTYAVFTQPEPIQASPTAGDPSLAELTIVVSNTTPRVVDCASISFDFLQGSNAKDLFDDARALSAEHPTGWSMTRDGGHFSATPDTTGDGKIGAAGLTFVISQIKINQQVGTTNLTITEVTSTGEREAIIPIAKFPPQFEVGDLKVTPVPPVSQGDSVTLEWSGSEGANYQLQYEDADGETVVIEHPKDDPAQALPAVGSYRIDNLQTDTTFYLIVTVAVPDQDEPLTVEKFFPVAVKVPSVSIKSFTANQMVVYGANNNVSVTLSWETVAAQQVTLNGNLVHGNSATVIVNETAEFTLGATGRNGPVYAELTIMVKDVNLVLSWSEDQRRNWLCFIATFGANPGTYSLDFGMNSSGSPRNGRGTVQQVVEGTSQIVTVVGPTGAFFDWADVTVTGFPSGPITVRYDP